jgi:hypothetical protein
MGFLKRLLPKRIPIFTIRVVYKSGYFHDFECSKFSYAPGRVEWNAFDERNAPISIGLDEIAAVYQVGYRHVWRFIRES